VEVRRRNINRNGVLLNLKLQHNGDAIDESIEAIKRAFKGKFSMCVREKTSFMKQGQRNFSFFLFYAFFLRLGPVFFHVHAIQQRDFDWKAFFSVFLGLLCFLFSFHMLFFLSFCLDSTKHNIYCDLIIIYLFVVMF
jgi:hypothetical protein